MQWNHPLLLIVLHDFALQKANYGMIANAQFLPNRQNICTLYNY
jgi:hypothetical protein